MKNVRSRSGNRSGRGSTKQDRTPRTWRVPPAIMRDPTETLEGIHILEEVAGRLGLPLWLAARDVMLWAATESENREGLFHPDAARKRVEAIRELGADPRIEGLLLSLAAIPQHPATVAPHVITLVCLELSRWLSEQNARASALTFAQAAALASPADAEPAVLAGQLARQRGQSERAVTWLRRAIGLARGEDWRSYVLAYAEMGQVAFDARKYDVAHRFFSKSLIAARRHSLKSDRGPAYHGLHRLAVVKGEFSDAETFARRAMRAYGSAHPRTRDVLHDLAYLWAETGRNTAARQTLQRLLVGVEDVATRALTQAILARVAAALGDSRAYEMEWGAAWDLIVRPGAANQDHGRALVELARAATACQDWLRVEQAARRLATQPASTDPGVGQRMEELLGLVKRARS